MSLPYDLGEMKSETGEVLRYEVEATASDLAVKLEELIQDYPVYRNILERVGSPRASLYFQKAIKSEIYPAVRDLCVLQWHGRNNVTIEGGSDYVSAPSTGICVLLEKIWPDQAIPLRIIKNVPIKQRAKSLYWSFRSMVRRYIDGFWAIYCRWKYVDTFRNFPVDNNMIALEYVEGLDLQRRSDIVWFPESGIDPSFVIIYFSAPDNVTGKPISKNVLSSIQKQGMKWVCLKKGTLEMKDAPVWYPASFTRKHIEGQQLRPRDRIGKWILRTGEILLNEIRYWLAFYSVFNIKIHCITGGSDLKYIAQSIAFDLNGSKKGFVVGKQRSELHWPAVCILGWYPVDVFFTWTPRAGQYLSPNVNKMITAVSTGYPNDLVFRHKQTDADQLKDSLRKREASYIISLFDNVHGPDIAHSTANVERFYLSFLNWLLEDKAVGVIIKSKKPSVLQRLPRVLPILEKAEATGRCIQLGDEFGRLPVDAAFASDISVGVGVSSAVIEAAIAGCRSIHCDFSCLRFHEFYRWGYERIIFDDLDRLVAAMKSHKSGNRNCSELGDWTPFLDRLDPFRDGRAGERMGTYLRWCLERFDEGLGRDEIIRRANEKYNERWGTDKAVMF